MSFCAESNFKMQWFWFFNSVYFERNAEIRMKRKLFIPDLLLLKYCVAFYSVNV
jgi:hypothetical protein